MQTPGRELWFTAPGKVELRQASVRAPAGGELRARALASGLSQGTELLLYKGEGPTPFDPSLDTPGTPTYPRRYGYAWIGEVTESQDPGWAKGARLFALLPHGDEHVLQATSARKIPDSIAPRRAVLAANLETAINVVWDAGVALGDRVVVLGGGIVGLLSAWLSRRAGAQHVLVVEPSAKRCQAALALGIDQALTPEADAPVPRADVVIEATGDPSSIDRAIAHAGFEATVALASFYGARKSAVDLGSDFHRRRLKLCSTQVSRLPSEKLARWDALRRFELVLELLADPQLDELIDPAVPFAQAPQLYARIAADPRSALQIVFSY